MRSELNSGKCTMIKEIILTNSIFNQKKKVKLNRQLSHFVVYNIKNPILSLVLSFDTF